MARAAPILAVVAVALVCAAPVAQAERHSGEAIVVLGAGVTAEGKPGKRLTARLESSLQLARQKPGALIVVSGGSVTSSHPEGPLMARWLVERGVSRNRIRIESSARHTGENADLVMPTLRKEGIKRAIVVTDRNHVPRARFHFQAARKEQGVRVKLKTFAVPDGLRGKARLHKAWSERGKIRRDRRSRAESRKARPPARGAKTTRALVRGKVRGR